VIAASFLLAPVRLAALFAAGRSPHCSFVRAVRAVAHERGLIQTKDRILAASRLVETDAQRFRRWRTPYGDFWIPPGQDYGLPFNLAEQAHAIYGTPGQAFGGGDVVLDCGANVGVFARTALAAGARLVVAIEPAPENLECLRRNLAAEMAAGRVIIYPKGVWDEETELSLQVSPANPAADSFVLRPEGSEPAGAVPVTTIDKMVEELALSRVDFIKMDIEGAERRALAGARQTLRRFRPRLAVSSYHLPDDPAAIPAVIHAAWEGYRQECGPCVYANGIIRPDVLCFHPSH